MRLPILNHPYYNRCTQLKVIFAQCKENDTDNLNVDQERMFMSDLFEKRNLFPQLKILKIISCFTPTTHCSPVTENVSDHYKAIALSPFLDKLEKLIIRDDRILVDWRPIQLMTHERFPSLKYLELPRNAFYDFEINEKVKPMYFPGLHLNFYQPNEYVESFNFSFKERSIKNYMHDKIVQNQKLTFIG
mmetsp:Transcript_8420/g.9558  ORF Transcript_8420/g.9558 Transcript_8420/m.9558 type:complete len:189 (-) Transcript_8420:1095-1661(-)